MKKSWGQFFRRVATACSLVIASSADWQTAVCYASAAADTALDPAYNDGWQAGDNGGSGFGAWTFAGNYADAFLPDLDSNDAANNLLPGRTWHLFNTGADVDTAGRGAPLAIGETLELIVDLPSVTSYGKGYTIRLNSGGAAVGVGGVERIGVYAYDSFDNDVGVFGFPDFGVLTDFDNGAKIEISLLSSTTFAMRMSSLDNSVSGLVSGPLFMKPGSGPIDFIEFQSYMPGTTQGATATDMYISSMIIRRGVIPEPSTAGLAVAAGGGLLAAFRRRRQG